MAVVMRVLLGGLLGGWFGTYLCLLVWGLILWCLLGGDCGFMMCCDGY